MRHRFLITMLIKILRVSYGALGETSGTHSFNTDVENGTGGAGVLRAVAKRDAAGDTAPLGSKTGNG
jgi:hypothetical protein